MHNLKELRKNLEHFKKKFEERNVDFDIIDFKKKDTLNRDLINKKEKLSSALKANIKLRKKQISNRDEKNIKGKRLLKVGYSSLLHKKLNNE